jgi:hypothetical protein
MIIHSKYKDYYDSIQAHGVDDRVRWVRNETELPIKTKFSFEQFSTFSEYGLEFQYIGFCGKIYPFLSYEPSARTQITELDKKITLFSEQEVYNFISESLKFSGLSKKDKEKNLKKYVDSGKKWGNYFYLNNSIDQKIISEYFKKYSGFSHEELFIKHKTPVFLIKKIRPGLTRPSKEKIIVINPNLSEYNFQKIIDPFTAYQEIDMYLSGVLGSSGEVQQQIPDKYMIKSKGFDDMSFKKYPEKNKK